MDKTERNETQEETCCCQKKERSEKERKDLINRLKRIEGQIRGIQGMVERDCYCPDIIVQVAAANAALNSFNKVLLGEHIRTCVAEDVREGNGEKVDELVAMLQKLMK
jgi:DNA-binding FrmR family transcriptional regulator